jgi:hypothetical protein
VIGYSHVDDLFFFIDFVEEAPGTDSVTPGRWIPIAKALDV